MVVCVLFVTWNDFYQRAHDEWVLFRFTLSRSVLEETKNGDTASLADKTSDNIFAYHHAYATRENLKAYEQMRFLFVCLFWFV